MQDIHWPAKLERLSIEQRAALLSAALVAAPALHRLASALAACARAGVALPPGPPPKHLNDDEAEHLCAMALSGYYTLGEAGERLAEMRQDSEDGQYARAALDARRAACWLDILVSALGAPPRLPDPKGETTSS